MTLLLVASLFLVGMPGAPSSFLDTAGCFVWNEEKIGTTGSVLVW